MRGWSARSTYYLVLQIAAAAGIVLFTDVEVHALLWVVISLQFGILSHLSSNRAALEGEKR